MQPETPYNPGMATDKAKLMVYMDPTYKEGLAKLAAIQNRSMSNYVETLIIEAVDKAIADGNLPGQPQPPAQPEEGWK
jgi:predicted HicB family RNase H-like nuclease